MAALRYYAPWGGLGRDGTYAAFFSWPDRRWLDILPDLATLSIMGPLASQRLATWVTKPNREDLLTLETLIKQDDVTPVADRPHGPAEAAEAMRHLDKGYPRGKVIVTVIQRGHARNRTRVSVSRPEDRQVGP